MRSRLAFPHIDSCECYTKGNEKNPSEISWAGALWWQLVLSELVKAMTEHNNAIWLLLQKLFSWGEFPLTKWRFENKSSLRGMKGAGGMFFVGIWFSLGQKPLGLYLILQPLNWWYSSLNVHLSSHRRSICVPNSTSLLQTNMLFSRWLPGKEPYRECAETWASFKLKVIHCWQWMQIAAAATKHLLLFFKRILHNLNKVLLFSTISTMHFFFVFLYKRPIKEVLPSDSWGKIR